MTEVSDTLAPSLSESVDIRRDILGGLRDDSQIRGPVPQEPSERLGKFLWSPRIIPRVSPLPGWFCDDPIYLAFISRLTRTLWEELEANPPKAGFPSLPGTIVRGWDFLRCLSGHPMLPMGTPWSDAFSAALLPKLQEGSPAQRRFAEDRQFSNRHLAIMRAVALRMIPPPEFVLEGCDVVIRNAALTGLWNYDLDGSQVVDGLLHFCQNAETMLSELKHEDGPEKWSRRGLPIAYTTTYRQQDHSFPVAKGPPKGRIVETSEGDVVPASTTTGMVDEDGEDFFTKRMRLVNAGCLGTAPTRLSGRIGVKWLRYRYPKTFYTKGYKDLNAKMATRKRAESTDKAAHDQSGTPTQKDILIWAMKEKGWNEQWVEYHRLAHHAPSLSACDDPRRPKDRHHARWKGDPHRKSTFQIGYELPSGIGETSWVGNIWSAQTNAIVIEDEFGIDMTDGTNIDAVFEHTDPRVAMVIASDDTIWLTDKGMPEGWKDRHAYGVYEPAVITQGCSLVSDDPENPDAPVRFEPAGERRLQDCQPEASFNSKKRPFAGNGYDEGLHYYGVNPSVGLIDDIRDFVSQRFLKAKWSNTCRAHAKPVQARTLAGRMVIIRGEEVLQWMFDENDLDAVEQRTLLSRRTTIRAPQLALGFKALIAPSRWV